MATWQEAKRLPRHRSTLVGIWTPINPKHITIAITQPIIFTAENTRVVKNWCFLGHGFPKMLNCVFTEPVKLLTDKKLWFVCPKELKSDRLKFSFQ